MIGIAAASGAAFGLSRPRLSVILSVACVLTASVAPAQGTLRESPDSSARPAGDSITLKTGKVISGVQILRATPLFYEVEITEGIEPLLLPRKMVEHVEYDDIDPLADRRRERMFPSRKEQRETAGDELEPALMDKLTAPLSSEEMSYEGRDLIEVLDELAKKQGVQIEIHKSVRNVRAERRAWNLTIAPDTSLMSVLQDHLLRDFKFLELEFQFDMIVVITKRAKKAATE